MIRIRFISVLCSKKKIQITSQGDLGQFLPWFLNSLHLALGGTKKRSSSVIYKNFLGSMKIHSKKILPTDLDGFRALEAQQSGEYEWKVEESPFLFLTSELPPPPLFKDEFHENIIPQVKEENVLRNGFLSAMIRCPCTISCPSSTE